MKLGRKFTGIAIALGAGTALAGFAAAQGTAPAPTPAYDIIIRGGTVYPGNEAPFVGDVAIKGDKIVYVGRQAPGPARDIVDAKGLIVAPGFIDPHTHIGDKLNSEDPTARLILPFLTQGVTTAFVGVDGGGGSAIFSAAPRPSTADVDALGSSNVSGTGVNYAAFVGLGAIRTEVIGPADRAPTDAELARMKSLVSDAMCRGALGFSTGLFYAPQSYAKRDEVIALAAVAAKHGGIYDSHIRDESSYTIGLKGAVDEAIDIGRATGIPVHIAHIKALGVDVHGQAPAVIAQIEAAQKSGLNITADQYPWSASGTGLSAALMPRWAQAGGREAMLKRFDEPETMAKIKVEMAENMRRRGGPASLLITSGPKAAQGRNLEQIAKETGDTPIEAAITILRQREAGVASFNQSEADIAAFMVKPWVVTSSDASLGHPRYYASFARVFAMYVKEKKVIDLRTFIERSTARTADIYGLTGRGYLKAGAYADVIAFDPATFAPRADYASPLLFSTGMRAVFVNGKPAILNGTPTGIPAGRPLARTPKGCA